MFSELGSRVTNEQFQKFRKTFEAAIFMSFFKVLTKRNVFGRFRFIEYPTSNIRKKIVQLKSTNFFQIIVA